MEKIYYGELSCQGVKKSGDKCVNKAYYKFEETYLCGVHSNKDKRVKLPVNPNKKKLKETKDKTIITNAEFTSKINANTGKIGTIVMYKLKMMKSIDYLKGYLPVFPNFLHGKRKDGFGCATLSPKSMGPVKVGGLPQALNLENWWQFSKVYSNEVDENNRPLPKFYETRDHFYMDTTPHRHKEDVVKIEYGEHNKNIPLYWLWVDKNGKEVKYNYVEARQFYCNIYERIALKNKEYLKLRQMVDGGMNIMICGYDAYSPKNYSAQELERCYLDSSRPFGHELVLLSLLILKSEDYPWRKYKTEDF